MIHDVMVQHAVLYQMAMVGRAGGTVMEVLSDRDIRSSDTRYDLALHAGYIPDAWLCYTDADGIDAIELVEMQISWDKANARERRLYCIDRTLAKEDFATERAHIWLANEAMYAAYERAINDVAVWRHESVEAVDHFNRSTRKVLWYRQTERHGGKSQPVRHHIETDIELHLVPDIWRSRYLGYHL